MAQQKITVEFAVESVERLRRAITEAIQEGRTTYSVTGKLEPVSIQTPDGERFLFIDSDNQEHWVSARVIQEAQSMNWRQAWFRL
jgi:hypothetical protein